MKELHRYHILTGKSDIFFNKNEIMLFENTDSDRRTIEQLCNALNEATIHRYYWIVPIYTCNGD